MNYSLWINGKEEGPYAGQDLENALAGGSLDGNTLARPADGGDWKPLHILIAIKARQPITPPKVVPKPSAARKPATSMGIGIAAGVLLLAGLIVGWFYLSGHASGQLNGQVFIATKGGLNVKLGQVEVVLIPVKRVSPWIHHKAEVIDSESARLKNSVNPDDMKALVHLFDADFYFEDLPRPDFSALTDADGKFSMKVPRNGKYIVAARARRSVGEEEEKYAWLFDFSMDGAPDKTIMLSNNNLTTTGAPGNIVLTGEQLFHSR